MSFKAWALNVKHDCQSFKGLAVIKYAALLLLSCHISWVNAAEYAPKKTDLLPDPTTSTTAKLRARLITPDPESTKNAPSSEEIKDPTKMNENFRAALNRLNKNTPAAGALGNSTPAGVSSFPQIKLLAAVCEHHPEKNHAMLSVNGKSEMVGVGEKITTILNNQVIEIEVLEIQKNHVHLRLHPSNEIIIVR